MPICNRRSEQVMDTKMYAAPDTPGADQANAAFDPARLAQDKSSRIASIAGLILTLATVAMIVVAARQLSLETIMAMLPTKPVFWIGRVRQRGVISAVALGHRHAAFAVMCRG